MKRRAAFMLILALALGTSAFAINHDSDVIVPAVGDAAGVSPSYWQSDLYITNPSSVSAEVTVLYLVRGSANPNPASKTYSIEPGKTLFKPRVMHEEFGVSGFGALRVTANVDVVVTTVIANRPEGPGTTPQAGSFAQGFEGIPTGSAVGVGGSTLIAGVSNSDLERSNFGAVDATGNGATFTAEVLEDGAMVASKTYTVGAWQPMQVNITDLHNSVYSNLTLRFTMTQGDAVFYASKINIGSGDPTTLEMHWEGD